MNELKIGGGRKRVTLLIPCYNEEQSLPLLYPELEKLMDEENKYEWEVLFVNDGSRDKTMEIIKMLSRKDSRVCYVDLSRNFGKENAMLAGFDYASGDCVVIMDADLQHPPHVVLEMLQKWEEGYEDVYGQRISRGKESWLRRRMSLLYYSLLQKSVRYDTLPNVGDFRLLDSKCIEVLRHLRETQRYTKGMFAWIGFKKTSVPFETQERVAGQSSWNYRALFGLAVEGITSFTVFPLKVSTYVGMSVSIAAMLYMIYVFAKTLLYGDPVQGYPTIIILLLFFSGVQLLSLGIIGEYLGRIFYETKHRPVYVVRESKTAQKHETA